MPAMFQILAVFACMLVLARVRVPLAAALLLGGITLDLCGGNEPAAIARHLGEIGASRELWLFLAVIVFITEVGRFMTRPENAREVVAAVSAWGGKHGKAWSVMALPAAIGLVPMPGGALFSAPLVQQVVAGEETPRRDDPDSEWKTAVNYWFRHIVEFWWPLYPGVIVAMSVFELEVWRFVSSQIVFTPAAVAAGYFILVRPHMDRLASVRVESGPVTRRFYLLVAVLLTVILCAVFAPLLGVFLRAKVATETLKLASMLLGLAAAAALIIADDARNGRFRFLAQAWKPESVGIVLTVGGVLVFKALLDRSGLVAAAASDMHNWGVPPVVAVAALPLLSGIVTGLAAGFAGTSFPLVVALAAAAGLPRLATLGLAYVCGHAGMMISPTHICAIVSSRYFAASLTGTLWRILPCAVAMMGFGGLFYLVMSLMGL